MTDRRIHLPMRRCHGVRGGCSPRGRILSRMGTKSRETIYGASIRAAADRATKARKEADRLAVWRPLRVGDATAAAITAGLWKQRTLEQCPLIQLWRPPVYSTFGPGVS